MENSTYLGDAVYARHLGRGIELMLNEHTAPCAVFLELEVLAALNAFHKRITPPAEVTMLNPETNPFADGIAKAEKKAKVFARYADALSAEGVPLPGADNDGFIWFGMTHEQTVSAIRILGGKWTKKLSENQTIDYKREKAIEGFDVTIFWGQPPPSCRIEEVTEEFPEQIIPAGTRTVRKLVCK